MLVSQHLADAPCPWQRAPGPTLPGRCRQPPPAPGVACSTASPLTSAYSRPWGLWPGPCPLPAPSTITISFPSQLQAVLSGLPAHRRLPPHGHYAKPFWGVLRHHGVFPNPPSARLDPRAPPTSPPPHPPPRPSSPLYHPNCPAPGERLPAAGHVQPVPAPISAGKRSLGAPWWPHREHT